jgi:hypothetical protein
VTLTIGGFELSGIAFGTIVLLLAYHGLRAALPASRRPPVDTIEGAGSEDTTNERSQS